MGLHKKGCLPWMQPCFDDDSAKKFRKMETVRMNDKFITISSPKRLQERCNWYKI